MWHPSFRLAHIVNAFTGECQRKSRISAVQYANKKGKWCSSLSTSYIFHVFYCFIMHSANRVYGFTCVCLSAFGLSHNDQIGHLTVYYLGLFRILALTFSFQQTWTVCLYASVCTCFSVLGDKVVVGSSHSQLWSGEGDVLRYVMCIHENRHLAVQEERGAVLTHSAVQLWRAVVCLCALSVHILALTFLAALH